MSEESKIQMIPINKINILNPRDRNKKKFSEIVDNISALGLKRPITVSRRIENKNDDGFDLVCGQGRLEAYIALGHKTIPAIIVNVAREDRLIMSLVENLARRNPQMLELYKQIAVLRDRKHSCAAIAKKVDMDPTLVSGILRLLDKGEERLLMGVDKGIIPISIAVDIAGLSDVAAQKALTDAYEKGLLKGKAMLNARNLIKQRETLGRDQRGPRRKSKTGPTADSVVKAYNKEVQRQKNMVKKANLCEMQLLFVINAMQQLLGDEHFINLLRAENLDTIPRNLAELVGGAAI
jgi:ParB family transcriptional regulator, chromosome partitioning protein